MTLDDCPACRQPVPLEDYPYLFDSSTRCDVVCPHCAAQLQRVARHSRIALIPLLCGIVLVNCFSLSSGLSGLLLIGSMSVSGIWWFWCKTSAQLQLKNE